MVDADPILELCRELGFANAGIADIAPSKWARELTEWLAAGKHGSMAWLEENLALRLNPSGLLAGARSAIMVADLYTARSAAADPLLEPGHGRIARYARGRDYHTVLKKRLHALADRLREQHAGHEFRAFTDTAPVLERELAERAGLGWVGKHTLLIHPRIGSYFFLGGLLTTLPIGGPTVREGALTVHGAEDGLPHGRASHPDHCGTCTRCIDACPTQAITPYSVDASRCIAYLTIEHRGEIHPELHAPIGDNLFGCDICQEVCPHNRGIDIPAGASAASANSTLVPPSRKAPMPFANPSYKSRLTSLPLLDILSWSPDDRSREFQSSALKRATLAMMKRNAVIVAGNLLRGDPSAALRIRIEQLATDAAEPEVVRTTAQKVLATLSRSGLQT